MVSEARIARIEREIARLEKSCGVSVTYVPIYSDETEADAVAAYDREPGNKSRQPHVIFAYTPGPRARAVASGLHAVAKLSPGELSSLLSSIDGRCRGVPGGTRMPPSSRIQKRG